MYTKSIEALQRLRENLAPLKEIYGKRFYLELFLDSVLMETEVFFSERDALAYFHEIEAAGSPYTYKIKER